MMLSNLNLFSLPECNFEVRYVDSVLLNPCAEGQLPVWPLLRL